MSVDQVTVVKQLGDLAKQLDVAVGMLGDLEAAAVEARRDYELAYERAYFAEDNSGPVEDRKQRAVGRTVDERRVMELAAAQVRTQKEAIKALHARIDVGRTMQATARAEVALSGTGVTT